ncbi:predicted protein [Phaeodactylum tricornutum CCAP 1055/1]|jgi:zinc transporter ZupT|uniref:Uncharacterized protein n=2 Tax=Phaeodactylum tricornutum TaxID=2850 RepID=B7FWD6_PHATC|nr:predicted protein [Phaeodactylum tricornutum CCAP 1055/1]EEC48963.1 predicted protein [Phaeodactylum tricornutum CCAP 1055/1]|eukprot:XP_002179140.1 predicted protein [Phaeodactylum tricornutum CCAP 1055/1]
MASYVNRNLSQMNEAINQLDWNKNAKRAVQRTSPWVALFGLGLVGGMAAASSLTTAVAKEHFKPGLEKEFGTADGYFPSATPGASLSKPPANRNVVVGKHYDAIGDRLRNTKTRRGRIRGDTVVAE